MTDLIRAAHEAAERRAVTRKPIDYDMMRRKMPSLKAALTRAVRTGDPEVIAAACVKAMNVWDEVGAWPDDWSAWQRALNDALPWHASVDIGDLPR